jgi:hypothetical protein
MSSAAILDEFFTQEAIFDKVDYFISIINFMSNSQTFQKDLTFFLSLAQLQSECYKSENLPGLRLPENFFETLSDIESRIDNITETDILQRILVTAEEQRDCLKAALNSTNNKDMALTFSQ